MAFSLPELMLIIGKAGDQALPDALGQRQAASINGKMRDCERLRHCFH
jgi:hypothetical protein